MCRKTAGMDTESAITVSLPKDLKRELRVAAAEKDISMAELLRQILSETLTPALQNG